MTRDKANNYTQNATVLSLKPVYLNFYCSPHLLFKKKKVYVDKHWWFISIILATQEAEIRELWFKTSPGKQFGRPYLKKNPSQKRADGVAQDEGPEFKPQYFKTNKQKV
jgi:hypothetical protein